MKKYISVLTLLLLCFVNIFSQVRTLDSLSLAALYRSTNGDGWINNTGWLTGTVDSWYGITVSNDSVIGIDLNTNRLEGVLTDSIQYLTDLKVLDLGDNLSLIGNLPDAFTNLTSLKILDFGNTNFSGIIPSSIQYLTNLHKIDMSYNALAGNILDYLVSFNLLDTINLNGNYFSGSIPVSIDNLSALKVLYLGNNHFDGDIPVELYNLVGLTDLSLANNDFTGTIPIEIGNLINLVSLNLSSNNFSGSIPSEIGDLTNITDLYLSRNSFSGTLPTSLGNLVNIDELAVSSNQFEGYLPSTINNLSLLRILYIDDNNFSGLCNLTGTNLNVLNLENNNLTFNDLNKIGFLPGSITSYDYRPQKQVSLDTIVKYFALGENVTLDITQMGGDTLFTTTAPFNRYEWYKDGFDISGNNYNDPTYDITGFSVTDTGLYHVVVTNGNYGSLTLYTDSVRITLENMAPLAVELSDSGILENSTDSMVAIFSSNDINAGDKHSYSLVTGDGSNDKDNDKVLISNDTLYAMEAFDHETLDSIYIYVRSTDQSGAFIEAPFVIHVDDQNEFPLALILSKDSIAENVTVSTLVGVFNTTDPDEDDVFTYQLITGNGANDADNNKFYIAQDSLKVNGNLNYEEVDSLFIYIRSEDSGGAFVDSAFIIKLLDQNDPPAKLEISVDSVYENSDIGSLVCLLSGVDEDDTVFTYSLVTGNGINDIDNDKFIIIQDSLKVSGNIDYEASGQLAVFMQIEDGPGLTLDTALIIRVINQNDPPVAIDITNTVIEENLSVGSFVGRVSTMDEDIGDNLHYVSLTNDSEGSGHDNAKFLIRNDSLIIAESPDYEDDDSLYIHIHTEDILGAGYDSLCLIEVLNINEPPTGISISSDSVSENVSSTLIGTITVFDNEETNDFINIYLTTGDGNNDRDNQMVYLNSKDLYINQSINYEESHELHIFLRTEDPEGNIYDTALIINVIDQNEAPFSIELDNSTIPEDVPPGTIVGIMITGDYDINDSHVYSFTTGDGLNDMDNDKFYFDGDSLKTNIDFTDQDGVKSIMVRVTDQEGLSYDQPLNILITSVTSIADINSGHSIQIFPAISDDFISINCSNISSDPIRYIVYNINGNVLLDQKINKIDSFELNIADSDPGIYIIIIFFADGMKSTGRFVKIE